MTLLLTYLFIALCVSFLCSVLEAVLLSISPSYIHALEQSGKTSGTDLKKLKENVDRPLSAILSLNTVAHTAGAAGVGAQSAILFGEAYLGIVSAVVTLLILILSEIIPKSLGAMYWRTLAPFAARVLKVMIIVMYPLVILSMFITNLMTKNKKMLSTSREEIAALATLGQEEGIFKEEESRVISNLIRLKSIAVRSIMTPRTVMVAIPEDMKVSELFRNKEKLRFSRIPIYRENIDHVSGYVLKHDVLNRVANDQDDVTMKEIKRDMQVIFEKKSISELFENLIKNKEHITLVVDEYGGVSGIATMEDVLETLLGLEILDELDSNADMQQLAREKWTERAKKLGIIPAFMEKKEKRDEDEIR